MRYVVWEPAAGDTIVFADKPPFMCKDFNPGVPSALAETVRMIRSRGQMTYFVGADKLVPNLVGSLVAYGSKDVSAQVILDRLRIKLQNSLNPEKTGKLHWHNEAGVFELACRPIAGATFGTRFGHSHKIDIEWMSDEPYWKSAEETEQHAGIIKKMWRFPWIIRRHVFSYMHGETIIVNTTSMDIYPIITVTSTSAQRITLANETTGQSFTVIRPVLASQNLVIDMSGPSVNITNANSGEVLESALHWLSLESEPWVLVPGVNKIKISTERPQHTPRTIISWRTPYVGL